MYVHMLYICTNCVLGTMNNGELHFIYVCVYLYLLASLYAQNFKGRYIPFYKYNRLVQKELVSILTLTL